MFAGQLALTIAAYSRAQRFTSTSPSSPARLQLDDRSLLAERKSAYKRGYLMQASLAIVGGIFGLVAFLSTLDWRWLLGALAPARKLAVHDICDPADQQASHGHAVGGHG
jgi:hypothetical protein